MTAAYLEYLASSAWAEKRARCIEQAGDQCASCCDPNQLQAHHLTYERLFNEWDQDLLCLCRAHHKLAEKLIKEGKIPRFGDVFYLRKLTLLLLRGKRRKANRLKKARTKSARPGFKRPKYKWSNVSETQRHKRAHDQLERFYS